jgi:hypothetical protein
LPDPTPDLDVPMGKRGRERGLVSGHAVAERAPLGRDKDRAQHGRPPATLGCDEAGHYPALPVQYRKQTLQVVQLGLDFDEQQRSLFGAPGKDVNRTLLPVAAERVLDDDLPPKWSQTGHYLFDERGVAHIDDPVELAATPARVEGHSDLENGADAADNPQSEQLELTSLNHGYGPLADARQDGHIALS